MNLIIFLLKKKNVRSQDFDLHIGYLYIGYSERASFVNVPHKDTFGSLSQEGTNENDLNDIAKCKRASISHRGFHNEIRTILSHWHSH